jgi:hypothetical protein
MVQRAWVNYATQFNWALTQLDGDTDCVLRLDADEYLTPGLGAEIARGCRCWGRRSTGSIAGGV